MNSRSIKQLEYILILTALTIDLNIHYPIYTAPSNKNVLYYC